MYNVSQDYIDALKAPAKVRKLTGTIGSTPFTDANIIQGSFEIDNQCASNSDINMGSVYMGQLTCLFTGIEFPAGQWMGKQITVSESLLLADNETWESVPLGIYTITEANHQEEGVFVTAYDNMHLLDKTFPYDTMVGEAYDLLTLISRDCDVALEQTQEEIEALPNGQQAFVLYSENDIETYRDFLFWIAQTLACFATVSRDGKIELRKYGGDVVYTVEQIERWTGSQFSDYVTSYTGVSVVNIEKQETIYQGAPVDNGMTYNLGSNPLMQGMVLTTVLNNILTELLTIQYTPFSVPRSGCPALDLGDAVEFPDGLGNGAIGCVMAYQYVFRGEYKISGYGSNPSLSNARSKTDKDISGLMSRTEKNEMQFYTFTNAAPLEVRDEYKEIMYIRFGSMKATTATFHAEIKLNAEAEVIGDVYEDIIGNIKYIFNDVELDYHPAETWMDDGDHLLHLLYYFPISEAQINRLSVRMNCVGGVLSIGQGNIQAAISGQGLAATDKWDGYIEAEDNIVYADFGTSGMTAETITEDAEVALADVIRIDIDESIDDTELDTTPEPMAVGGTVYINKKPLVLLTWGEVQDMEWSAEGITDGEDTYSW